MKQFLILVFVTISMSVFSQERRETIDGEEYIVHTIKKGETLYGITKKYAVSKKDLRAVNPGMLLFIKEGQELRVPVPLKERAIHTVKKGETLYGISKIYGMTVEELVKLNPVSSKDLQDGVQLKLKGKKTTPASNPKEIKTKKPHLVKKGETLYGISKMYGVSIEELKKLNPGMSASLSIGDTIWIPSGSIALKKEEVTRPSNLPKPDSKIIEYTVEKGETFYGISKKYNTSVEAIQKANPGVESLKEGDKLNIELSGDYLNDLKNKLKDMNPAERILLEEKLNMEGKLSDSKAVLKKETYSISLFLPLMLDLNAQLPAAVNKPKRMNQYTEMSTHFYQGVQLALDSVTTSGVSFELEVFDTRKDSSVVAKQLKGNSVKNTDLIIGPMFEKPFRKVADFSKSQGVQMVCPVQQSNVLLFNNQYVTELSTSFPTQVEYLAKYLAENKNTENVICVSGKSKEEKFLDGMFESSYNKAIAGKTNNYRPKVGKYSLTSYSSLNGFDEKMVKGKKNIIVLPVLEKGMATSFFTQLNVVMSRSRMKGYEVEIYALENFLDNEEIESGYKMKFNLHVTTSSFIDYKDEKVIEFVKKYRKKYQSEPTKFAFMGFDAAFFHAAGLSGFGKNYTAFYNQIRVPLLQSDYNMQRNDGQSGFENKTVFILAYRDFELVKVN